MADPTREQVDAMTGITVPEFGASWCPICQAAWPTIDRVLGEVPEVAHVWVEDGKGKRLGRSFGVKLWPTLIVLRDVVRPTIDASIREAISRNR